jgi:hypothetical protein
VLPPRDFDFQAELARFESTPKAFVVLLERSRASLLRNLPEQLPDGIQIGKDLAVVSHATETILYQKGTAERVASRHRRPRILRELRIGAGSIAKANMEIQRRRGYCPNGV